MPNGAHNERMGREVRERAGQGDDTVQTMKPGGTTAQAQTHTGLAWDQAQGKGGVGRRHRTKASEKTHRNRDRTAGDEGEQTTQSKGPRGRHERQKEEQDVGTGQRAKEKTNKQGQKGRRRRQANNTKSQGQRDRQERQKEKAKKREEQQKRRHPQTEPQQ